MKPLELALILLFVVGVIVLVVAFAALADPKAWRLQSTPPDRYGVVCYSIRFEPSSLSCVKVTP